jgi:hypothetical protein
MVNELKADEFTDGVSFLPDRVRCALVVDIDDNEALSGNVSVVGDGNELLI